MKYGIGDFVENIKESKLYCIILQPIDSIVDYETGHPMYKITELEDESNNIITITRPTLENPTTFVPRTSEEVKELIRLKKEPIIEVDIYE